ncbi:hypothetical protein DUI87_15070 [Hirundo rustica rustica]|uniref:Uncharacterized protein n=1 Tax=Hirundo rustica rustica TaxID=333673 RepID=A0A3M0K6N8_HIRRU|nr:hypothetical protein DUI87_15070 [Hirundo rustica rustica]
MDARSRLHRVGISSRFDFAPGKSQLFLLDLTRHREIPALPAGFDLVLGNPSSSCWIGPGVGEIPALPVGFDPVLAKSQLFLLDLTRHWGNPSSSCWI